VAPCARRRRRRWWTWLVTAAASAPVTSISVRRLVFVLYTKRACACAMLGDTLHSSGRRFPLHIDGVAHSACTATTGDTVSRDCAVFSVSTVLTRAVHILTRSLVAKHPLSQTWSSSSPHCLARRRRCMAAAPAATSQRQWPRPYPVCPTSRFQTALRSSGSSRGGSTPPHQRPRIHCCLWLPPPSRA